MKIGNRELLRVYTPANVPKVDGRPSIDCHIFLGGNCGRTTWRAEQAIPTLKRLAFDHAAKIASPIIVFNPQVAEWKPEYEPFENVVKARSRVLLFALGKETRAIASMIEVAEYAIKSPGSLVVALEPIDPNLPLILEKMNGPLPTDEVGDLSRGRAYLDGILKRSGVTMIAPNEYGKAAEMAFSKLMPLGGHTVDATTRTPSAVSSLRGKAPPLAYKGRLSSLPNAK